MRSSISTLKLIFYISLILKNVFLARQLGERLLNGVRFFLAAIASLGTARFHLEETAAGSLSTAWTYALSAFPEQCKGAPKEQLSCSGVCLLIRKLNVVRAASLTLC